jgi:hypothetical protein
MSINPKEIDIDFLENTEFWSQRAIDLPDEVLAELEALRLYNIQIADQDKNQSVKDVENFNESDESGPVS